MGSIPASTPKPQGPPSLLWELAALPHPSASVDPWNSLLNALLLLHLDSTLFLGLSEDVHDCAFGVFFFFSFFLEQLILHSRIRPSATDASRTYSGNSLGMVQHLTFDL